MDANHYTTLITVLVLAALAARVYAIENRRR
jgi:hypothetical protein